MLEAGADDPSLNDLVETDLKVDGFSFVLGKKPALVDNARVIVLFDDVNDVFACGITQDDRVRLEHAGYVGGCDLIGAFAEIEVNRCASHCKALVVDGERYRLQGCLLRRRARNGERKCYDCKGIESQCGFSCLE